MKNMFLIGLFIFAIASCHSTKTAASAESKEVTKKEVAKSKSDTVRIANDDLEYEVIIIDAGFNSWLVGRAKPRGYYSEVYLENRNRIYIPEWNSRVLHPTRDNADLYTMQIDYSPTIHYGYEVNYLLYNYFIYFQEKYNQNLGGFVVKP